MVFKSLKEVKKAVAGGTLTVTQFPVLRAIRIGGRVAKVVAPVIAGLGGGIDLDGLVGGTAASNVNIELNKAIPGALRAVAETLDPDVFAAACQELLSGSDWVDANGTEKIEFLEPGSIDKVFGGSIPDLFLALRTVLEANDFFGLGAIGKLRGMVRAAPNPPPLPAESTKV